MNAEQRAEAKVSGQAGRSVARTSLIATAVAVAVAALALWKLRIVIALLFFAITLAASMRPGVDRLAARKVPRSLGVLLHYLALVGLVGLFLWFVVPHLISGCGISRQAASLSTRP